MMLALSSIRLCAALRYFSTVSEINGQLISLPSFLSASFLFLLSPLPCEWTFFNGRPCFISTFTAAGPFRSTSRMLWMKPCRYSFSAVVVMYLDGVSVITGGYRVLISARQLTLSKGSLDNSLIMIWRYRIQSAFLN